MLVGCYFLSNIERMQYINFLPCPSPGMKHQFSPSFDKISFITKMSTVNHSRDKKKRNLVHSVTVNQERKGEEKAEHRNISLSFMAISYIPM